MPRGDIHLPTETRVDPTIATRAEIQRNREYHRSQQKPGSPPPTGLARAREATKNFQSFKSLGSKRRG